MQLSFGQSMNLSNVDPNAKGDFDPLPAGWYAGVAVKIDVQTKEWGLGANVEMKVTEGQYANRLAFDYLTLMHRGNQQANDIGQKKLRQWCDATGTDFVNLQSAEPFLGKLVKFRLSIQPAKPYMKDGIQHPGKAKNRIDAFASYDGAASAPAAALVAAYSAPVQQAPAQVAPVAAARAVAQAVAAAKPAGTMPWNKR